MYAEPRVKFWGVRGSYPTPGRGTVKYGGNTACVEIQAGARTIILDAGTGIIPLGRELARVKHTNEIVLLLSHLHHDHTQGLPFFLPAYLPNAKLNIFGPDGTHESLRNVLEHNQSSETFPISMREMASSKEIQPVRESQVIVWDEAGIHVAESAHPERETTFAPGAHLPRAQVPGSAGEGGLNEDAVLVRVHKSYAHPGGVYAYRITWRGISIVYATDTEGYIGTDKRLVAFAQNADLLIHDAQYSDEHYWGGLTGFPSTQGYGHSTVSMACGVATAARVKRLILFHHDPSYSDEMVAALESAAKEMFRATQAAYEGFEIILGDEIKITERLQSSNLKLRDVKYAHHD